MELMIVIVILGLLASFVMPNILGQSEKAKKKLVCTQMESIKNALRMFKVDNGTYPSTEEGLEALSKNPSEDKYKNYADGSYFTDGLLPRDSWGNDFIYLNEDGDLEIISMGADNKEGGKEEGADLTLTGCRKR
ncbi:MAG TPA: type II secretion system protein GspG [Sulfurimonas sp.]|nr:type II secretion system protein GspG [Sulfurimonas sp.]